MVIHEQVIAKCGDKEISVDVGMKTLLESMWAKGIRTISSCQENKPGIAWIGFPSSGHAGKFMEIAWHGGNASLKLRIERYPEEPRSSWADQWEYDIVPMMNEGSFYMPVSVRFPVSDLPRLEEIFK